MLQLEITDANACAPAGLTAALSRQDAEQLARLLKAISDPTRLQLISLINSSSGAESCACNLTAPLGLSQPTISHHLKVLAEVGLIEGEKRGTWIWYTVKQERWHQLTQLIEL